ncbi:MAG: SPOR domain-containing protein [Deltaproteobacteria bacterium]|nr:SPOR domain-containing protein [Deltaproteobacteria bacterium]MBW1793539.1 SPOR domain-containing protein [Deltaproteobacteria bacterium]MBW2330679.1 SPOR domain-containing protein [Deltaproteobacteria bacterium]
MQILHPVVAKKRANKQKPSGQKKRAPIQLTRKQLFLWLGLAFLAMVWMFALGILVGRGLSPVRFDVPKLKRELMALKQEALKRDQARFKVETDYLSGNPDLDFYKILTDKKEEARLKFAKAHKQTAKPDVKSPEVFKPKKMGGRGLLTIQVASLKNARKARQEVARLKRKGYEAYEVTVNVPGKGTYHRVRVGHFADSSEAGRVAARLKQDKLETMIVRE